MKVKTFVTLLLVPLFLSACNSEQKKEVKSTDSSSVTVLNTVESFDASSDKYHVQNFKKFKDIPETVEVDSKKLKIAYIVEDSKKTGYDAYYEK